jgi:carotenoid cleavage dioxygenase-like enzyme
MSGEGEIMLATAAKTDYRLGFTTLERETDVAALPLEGTLPAWLAGTLLRNGPARFEVGAQRYRHWFDGLAMVHRFTLEGGGVSYANRFLRSPGFVEAERTGRIAYSEFATDPQRSLAERVGDGLARRGGSSNNANVNIVPFRDGYLALTETPAPVAFDGTTLATRGVLSYDDDVAGQVTTAHTHYDPQRRATFNVVVEIGRVSRYHVVRIADGTLRRETIASIGVDKPAYLHAFATTERYVIVVEYPLVLRPMDLLLRRKPYIENYRWEPGRGTRFHVIEKDGGALAGTYQSDAFFAFHHINAFDDGDSVVLDISAYDDAAIVGDFRLERLLAEGAPATARPSFRRFRLVPGRAAAEVDSLAAVATELPSVARGKAARPYTFAYGVDVAARDGWAAFDSLVKIDVRTRDVARWSAPGAYPGEPVFVPRPGATAEDDGAVLSVVLDAGAGTSYLLVLDARTFEEQARAHAPHHIPFGFHGMFRSAAGTPPV